MSSGAYQHRRRVGVRADRQEDDTVRCRHQRRHPACACRHSTATLRWTHRTVALPDAYAARCLGAGCGRQRPWSAGFDNGRLLAANVSMTAWSNGNRCCRHPPAARISSDWRTLMVAIAAVGQDVYAAGYQGRVAALAAESGQILWAREVSTYAGIGADWDQRLYGLPAMANWWRWRAAMATNEWRVRRVSCGASRRHPVPFDTAVAVGDFEGYVHFFDSAADGKPVARRARGQRHDFRRPHRRWQDACTCKTNPVSLAAFEVEQPEASGCG